MKASEMFVRKSKYFRASDLTAPITLTIANVGQAEFGADGQPKELKPYIEFSDHQQMLVINKTNADILTLLFGDDTDAWHKQRITLSPARTPFKGKVVDTIRVGKPNSKGEPHPFGDQPSL
jgi:hypothetical protein